MKTGSLAQSTPPLISMIKHDPLQPFVELPVNKIEGNSADTLSKLGGEYRGIKAENEVGLDLAKQVLKKVNSKIFGRHEKPESQSGYNNEKQHKADADENEINAYNVSMYICFAILIALFVKKILLKWFCGANSVNANCRPQSIEHNRLVDKAPDEASPLFLRDDTCDWCNIVKRSHPMRIPKVQNDSPQGSYHSNSAEYDLLTWRMYHRITSSRRAIGHHPVKDIHILCELCRDDASEEGTTVNDNETNVVADEYEDINETENEDKSMMAFSFEPEWELDVGVL